MAVTAAPKATYEPPSNQDRSLKKTDRGSVACDQNSYAVNYRAYIVMLCCHKILLQNIDPLNTTCF